MPRESVSKTKSTCAPSTKTDRFADLDQRRPEWGISEDRDAFLAGWRGLLMPRASPQTRHSLGSDEAQFHAAGLDNHAPTRDARAAPDRDRSPDIGRSRQRAGSNPVISRSRLPSGAQGFRNGPSSVPRRARSPVRRTVIISTQVRNGDRLQLSVPGGRSRIDISEHAPPGGRGRGPNRGATLHAQRKPALGLGLSLAAHAWRMPDPDARCRRLSIQGYLSIQRMRAWTAALR